MYDFTNVWFILKLYLLVCDIKVLLIAGIVAFISILPSVYIFAIFIPPSLNM